MEETAEKLKVKGREGKEIEKKMQSVYWNGWQSLNHYILAIAPVVPEIFNSCHTSFWIHFAFFFLFSLSSIHPLIYLYIYP